MKPASLHLARFFFRPKGMRSGTRRGDGGGRGEDDEKGGGERDERDFPQRNEDGRGGDLEKQEIVEAGRLVAQQEKQQEKQQKGLEAAPARFALRQQRVMVLGQQQQQHVTL